MKDEIVEFKKVIFTSQEIIIKKRKKNIVIPLKNIKKLCYAKATFRNYLALAFGERGDKTIAALYIYLKEKIGKKKMYISFIRYKNLIKIPKKTFDMIQFYDPWSSNFWD